MNRLGRRVGVQIAPPGQWDQHQSDTRRLYGDIGTRFSVSVQRKAACYHNSCMGTPAAAFANDHQRRSSGAYYPLRLTFSYTAYCDGDVIQRGTGETTEISSASVRVKIDDIVNPDVKQIKLSIAWPATLGDGARLQFVVQGEPWYAGPRLAEVAFWKYEFKTAPRRATNVEAGVANGRVPLPRESLNASSAPAATF